MKVLAVVIIELSLVYCAALGSDSLETERRAVSSARAAEVVMTEMRGGGQQGLQREAAIRAFKAEAEAARWFCDSTQAWAAPLPHVALEFYFLILVTGFASF